uniref:40S ribosomal protein S27 n=1 Tax=Schistocephalus solidus TaxID=70667 RepID=A0A0X3PYD0_SCHSO
MQSVTLIGALTKVFQGATRVVKRGETMPQSVASPQRSQFASSIKKNHYGESIRQHLYLSSSTQTSHLSVLYPELATMSQFRFPASWRAKDPVTARAYDRGLSVTEYHLDLVTIAALDIHEVGIWRWNQPLKLTFPLLFSKCRVKEITCKTHASHETCEIPVT